MNHSFSKKKQSRGVLSVELAIVVPIVVLMLLGGIEFAQSLRVYESLVSINRQLNTALFRMCLTRAPAQVQACIDNELTRVAATAPLSLPNVRLMASRWNFDLGTCTMTHFGVAGATIPGYATPRVSAALPEMLQSCQDQGVMYFGEVVIVHLPLVPYISSILGIPSNGVYYVALGV